MHDNGRSDWKRRNRKNGDHHPVRTGETWVHAQHPTVLVRNVLEDFQHTLSREFDLPLLRLLVDLLPFGRQLYSGPSDLRLESTTPTTALHKETANHIHYDWVTVLPHFTNHPPHAQNVAQRNWYVLAWSHLRCLLDRIAWSPRCLLLHTCPLSLPFRRCTGAAFGGCFGSSLSHL